MSNKWGVTEKRQVRFNAVVNRFIFTDNKTEESKYQVQVINELEGGRIFKNRRGLTNISGQMPDLADGNTYEFLAVTEIDETYGAFYKVKEVSIYIPETNRSKIVFLKNHVGEVKASKIIDVYPDAINMLMNDQDIDISKIYGVGPKTMEKLKKALQDNYEDFRLFKEFNGALPYRIIKAIKEIINRKEKPKTLDEVKHLLKTKPYRFLTSLNGIGFKTADKIIYNTETNYPGNDIFPRDVLTSIERFRFASMFYLELEMFKTGNTYIQMSSILSFLRSSVIGITEEKIQEVISDKEMFVISKNGKYISSRVYFDKENCIYEEITKAMNSKRTPRPIVDLESYRDMITYDLSDAQLSVIPMVLNNKISILNGYAGTGKTSTIQKVIEYMENNGYTYKLMAPTGKASKVLSKNTKQDARTIHVSLGCTSFNDETGYVRFLINKSNPFKEDFIIVDEASMIDTLLMYDLIQGIDFNKTNLLLIGDDAQLPSVGPGNVFSVLKESGIPKAELKTVHRFGIGGISTESTNARMGLTNLPNNTYFNGDLGDSYYFEPGDINQSVDSAINKYMEILDGSEDFDKVLMLTYKRKNTDIASTENINQRIQSLLLEKEPFIKEREKETRFKVGDYVMQTRNDYSAYLVSDEDVHTVLTGGIVEGKIIDEELKCTIINGETGVIIESFNSGIIIKFGSTSKKDSESKYVYVFGDRLNNIELAYCMTIHKSQGSQAPNTVIITPRNHSFGMTSNLLYVAISRTKESCYHYGDNEMINRASKIREHVERKTTLENLFKNTVEVQ